MIVCGADEKLYPASTKRWYEYKLSSYTGENRNKQRKVNDNALAFPQLSLDVRDARYNVINSETVDLRTVPYTFLGVPTTLYKGTFKTIKYTTASKIFKIICDFMMEKDEEIKSKKSVKIESNNIHPSLQTS